MDHLHCCGIYLMGIHGGTNIYIHTYVYIHTYIQKPHIEHNHLPQANNAFNNVVTKRFTYACSDHLIHILNPYTNHILFLL